MQNNLHPSFDFAYHRKMKIGIPKETMTGEARVALIPETCRKLIASGYHVFVQSSAGDVSGYSDDAYREEGVEIMDSAEQLYGSAELIVKVK